MRHNQTVKILLYLGASLVLRFVVADRILAGSDGGWMRMGAIAVIFVVGIGFVFHGTARVIEETTDVLKDRTGLAGGFLQAFGTAFPDMVIGIAAAIASWQARNTDYARAVNLGIIAASTTFGSNIYNIAHAGWCVYRQNMADLKRRIVPMIPRVAFGGSLTPLRDHAPPPRRAEMDGAIRILTALTLLTAFAAVGMVLSGRVRAGASGIEGDLYQLVRPVGVVLMALCIGVLYRFRKSHRPESPDPAIILGEKYYAGQPTVRLWADLLMSGGAILFAAESMVRAMEVFAHMAHLPYVVAGMAAGLIGCFGEMLVIHNFSVHPRGRIGDAITGVAMDNIVTTMGAGIVAILGGIFLGSNALILIFVVILAANTVLIEQVSCLKNNLPADEG